MQYNSPEFPCASAAAVLLSTGLAKTRKNEEDSEKVGGKRWKARAKSST
jgi:hypothetical protein